MTESPSFMDTQRIFAAHLRDPINNPAPEGIEDRRMAIYRDLIYNNVESFISNGFPVLRSVFNDDDWRALVRDFIRVHRCHTPYFLEISQEFLSYLEEEKGSELNVPAFAQELAHYEWVELALDVSEQLLPDNCIEEPDFLEDCFEVSPLAWNLSYQYPVQRISRDFQPSELPELPIFLVVYRDRGNEVKFIEVNAVTSTLLQKFGKSGTSGRTALTEIAVDLEHPDPQSVMAFGVNLIDNLFKRSVLYTPTDGTTSL